MQDTACLAKLGTIFDDPRTTFAQGLHIGGVGNPEILKAADIVVNDLTAVDIDFLKALYSNEELHQA